MKYNCFTSKLYFKTEVTLFLLITDEKLEGKTTICILKNTIIFC